MPQSRTRICTIHIGQNGVPGARSRTAELGTQRTILTQHNAYAVQDFAGGRPGADSRDKHISHARLIGAPQFCYDSSQVGPPRLQFNIRHACLQLTLGRLVLE
jgi:hypothetical protein